MPALGTAFGTYADRMLALCTSVELARDQSPSASVARRQLTLFRLGYLYEAAYLRIFAGWESFLEECCIRYMAGYHSPLYSPVHLVAGTGTLALARAQLYGNRDYLLWANPTTARTRVAGRLAGCPIETVVHAAKATLEPIANVRHRIAHDSADARSNFDASTMALAGRRYAGSRPGSFLRASDGVATRWLPELTLRLKGFALQMAP